MKPVHIIGVSLDLGGNRRGVDMGPSAFRIAGLTERLTGLGLSVVDHGDLVAPIPEIKSEGDPHKKYMREISRLCEKLYRTSLTALEKVLCIRNNKLNTIKAGKMPRFIFVIRRQVTPVQSH